ncbi:hypothetical protein BC629DRAFT_1493171 [Irpex lacteus]|nr:hypothetical protein BC629DRAFT_1493171 [Irpex lacteus]
MSEQVFPTLVPKRTFVCPVKPRTSVESGRAVFPTLNPTSLAATTSPLHFCVFF